TTGAWTVTAPAEQPSGAVNTVVTDAAGNAGAGDSVSWTSSDTTPPDTGAAGTTVTVGVIAGDGVVNSTEAGATVPVTVTLANVPADAATTTVNVRVNGQSYA
ncbi:hypothetical protein, partial [Comamonas sp. NoAH]|uniref:hypothetical protein n=1 Tax=Comamonas halotolerans TaxID=3041496 RepID=UPI0024E170CD